MTIDDLIALATSRAHICGCVACSALNCKGWESLPGSYNPSDLHAIGTLVDPEAQYPTVEEYHPNGTHSWSADAPIAPAWFPYNRCSVSECVGCGKLFLRYTEYGGYYTDERIRELQTDLISGAAYP